MYIQVWFSVKMHLTLNMLNCFKDHKICIHILHHILDFVFNGRRPDLQWSNPTCCLSYTVNIIPADALGSQRARASAGKVLTPQSQNVLSPALEELTIWRNALVCRVTRLHMEDIWLLKERQSSIFIQVDLHKKQVATYNLVHRNLYHQ